MFASTSAQDWTCGCSRCFERRIIPAFSNLHFGQACSSYLSWRRNIPRRWGLWRWHAWSFLLIYLLVFDTKQLLGFIWVKVDELSLLRVLALPVETMIEMIRRVISDIVHIFIFDLICISPLSSGFFQLLEPLYCHCILINIGDCDGARRGYTDTRLSLIGDTQIIHHLIRIDVVHRGTFSACTPRDNG